MKGYGSLKKIEHPHGRLPSTIKAMVTSAGFSHVIKYVDPRKGVIEKFWDTTNTSRYPTGEKMIIPMDFYLLTGPPLGKTHESTTRASS